MEKRTQLLVIPAFILGLAHLTLSQTATAALYSYNVDLFAVTKLDATHNQTGFEIDNFDDNILSPWWVDNGTAEENGGVVILKSPGSVGGDTWEGVTELGTELTSSETRFDVIGTPYANATSRWLAPTLPSVNQSYEMELDIEFSNGVFIGDKIAGFSVGILNVDPYMAAIISAALGENVPAGLSGFFTREIEDEEFGIETTEIQITPIMDDLGSALLLGLSYDSVLNEVSARFSFDETAIDFTEGVELWEPFQPYAIPQIAPIVVLSDWDLEASSYTTVPTPGAFLLICSGLLGLFGFNKRKRAT